MLGVLTILPMKRRKFSHTMDNKILPKQAYCDVEQQNYCRYDLSKEASNAAKANNCDGIKVYILEKNRIRNIYTTTYIV